ncbi:MAG: glycosyltransferase family 2 protein [Cephaloticoccus sp.]|nr:glycosyltransferase family 2 protein [Cephaloticoccus sp.]
MVIPVYNRGELIRYTLESVRRASDGLNVEVIIVDDGSTEPASDSIGRLGYQPEKIIRQKNQGLLFARLTGLSHATGSHVLFLDSDDIVSPEKFRVQLTAMSDTGVETSYSDSASVTLEGDYDSLVITPHEPLLDTINAAELFICVQPAPHSPIFRTDYLRHVVNHAFFPPSPLYNPVAEIWFYQNAAPLNSRVIRVPGPHTVIGGHTGARLTNHWERLAVASLAVMESFARNCPTDTPEARKARELLGKVAFLSWRKLPRGFSPEFCAREMALSLRLMPNLQSSELGGRGYQFLASMFGQQNAARLLKHFQTKSYQHIRTMEDATFQRLLAALPTP